MSQAQILTIVSCLTRLQALAEKKDRQRSAAAEAAATLALLEGRWEASYEARAALTRLDRKDASTGNVGQVAA